MSTKMLGNQTFQTTSRNEDTFLDRVRSPQASNQDVARQAQLVRQARGQKGSSAKGGGTIWQKLAHKHRVRNAEEADAAILATPEFRGWVGHGSVMAKGRTTFHKDFKSFQEAWWQYVHNCVNENTPRSETGKEAKGLGGFTNPIHQEVHINMTGAEADTTIHEALHLKQKDSFLRTFGKSGMEGATDLFTEIVCQANGIPFDGGPYSKQRKAMEALKDELGLTALMAAYFHGDDKLAKMIDLKGKGTVKRYRALLDAGEWRKATALIKGLGRLHSVQERAKDKIEAAKRAREAKEREVLEAKLRKSWPKEGKAPVKAMVDKFLAPRSIRLNRGGQDGVREGWTGFLLDKHGKAHPNGGFQITKVTTQHSYAEVQVSAKTIMKNTRLAGIMLTPY